MARWLGGAAVLVVAAIAAYPMFAGDSTDVDATLTTTSEVNVLSPDEVCAIEVGGLLDVMIPDSGQGERFREAWLVYGANDPRTQLAQEVALKYRRRAFEVGRQLARNEAIETVEDGCRTIGTGHAPASGSSPTSRSRDAVTTTADLPTAQGYTTLDDCRRVGKPSEVEAASCTVMAWLDRDRSLARNFAEEDALDKLFSWAPKSPGEFDGCQHFTEVSDPTWEEGSFRCSYAGGDGGQGLTLYVDGGASAGYMVISLER